MSRPQPPAHFEPLTLDPTPTASPGTAGGAATNGASSTAPAGSPGSFGNWTGAGSPAQAPAQPAYASAGPAYASAGPAYASAGPARSTTPGAVDARPVLARRSDSIWRKVDHARDQLFDALQDAVRLEKHDMLVIKSGPFEQPAWVKVEAWVPRDDAGVTERAHAVIEVRAHEFHRFPIVHTVTLVGRGKRHVIGPLHDFGPQQAQAVVQYVLGRGARPRFGDLRLRRFGWQLWRPKNKVDVFTRDYAAVLPMLLFSIALAAWTWMTEGTAEGARPAVALTGAVVAAVAAVVAAVALARRRTVVRSAGRPEGEPRHLVRVDSWQTVVAGLGDCVSTLHSRLSGVFQQAPPPGLRSRLERIWYWGLEGTEEREQIVLTLGRAMCFVHVYRYGTELYVGWDGHLNRAQWVEKPVASGFDRTTRRLTEVRTVECGVQPLNEYDVTDLNCLIEWTHAKLVEQVKRLMAERSIDQEIDFKIQRGERQGLTGSAPQATPRGVGTRVAQKLRRTE